MNKVYIVVTPYMDDFEIQGVFSSRSAADEFMNELAKTNLNVNVQEHLVDSCSGHLARSYWYCAGHTKQGKVTAHHSGTMVAAKDEEFQEFTYNHNNYLTIISFISDEHAKEIFLKRAAEILETMK